MATLRNRLHSLFPLTVPASNGKHAAAASAAPEPEQKALTTSGVRFVTYYAPDGSTTEMKLGGQAYGAGAYAMLLCYAAINYRARKLVEAPLMVVEESDDGETWLENHELAPLLDQPNADQEMQDIIEETSQYMDLTGRALWIKDYDRAGRVGRLTALSGDEFQVLSDPGRLYSRFRIETANNRIVTSDDVVFFRFPHPGDRLAGFAPVAAVSRHLGIGDALTAHVRRALEHAAMPGGVFTVPADRVLSDDEFNRLDAKIRARFAGGNSFHPFLGEGGLTYTPTAHTLKDIQAGELWREVEAAVCTAFGVRPEVLGMIVGLENSPWSHMSTAQRLSYDEAIIPLWTRYERTLTRQLLRPIDDDRSHLIRFDRSRVPALQEDMQEKASIAKDTADVLTINERRVFLGFDPLDDERGDQITAGAPQGTPDRQANEDPQDELAARRNREAASGPAPAESKQARQAAERLAFDYLTSAHESQVQWIAEDQLRQDRADVLALVDGYEAKAKPTPAAVRRILELVDEHFSGDGPARQRWEAATKATLEGLVRVGSSRGPRAATSLRLTPEEIARYADGEAGFLVQSVTETTREAVRREIIRAAEARETASELKERLLALGEFSEARAELIARTETTRVLNGAAHAAAEKYTKMTGRALTKTWLTAQDDRVRDEHRALHGEVALVGAAFSNGRVVPDQPNCRCTISFEEAPR